ncbi:UDP-2,3-diacylglucosamine diphosphatase [Propionivibrio limicola]|uniref:UDP-2,3-diacylglucosamine diphosphatase n=1 Tax=Propionivibrio limicola TaxID=167645 RepID=UPI0012912205|nr:UDP-2,3-diacylglucosamine diphosphatase [Propionivibrio limicola]
MIHFLSDLHLSPQTPSLTGLFLDYLGKQARGVEHVFILGDLFEAWPGDDCIDAPEDSHPSLIVNGLRHLTENGVNVSVMHGNRDFLLGEGFAKRSGCRLIPDPFTLSLPGGQFVLSHGDALCTDDRNYLDLRRHIRTEEWKRAFLDQPLARRREIIAGFRVKSEESKREKQKLSPSLMDVNAVATDDFLRAHGYATFIHGHTHRPETHEHMVDGILVERWVLSDWRDDCGQIISWDGEKLRREYLRFAPQ